MSYDSWRVEFHNKLYWKYFTKSRNTELYKKKLSNWRCLQFVEQYFRFKNNRKIIFETLSIPLWASVHFDRFALFQFFSLDEKLFATSKFSNKNFFEHKLPLFSSLCIIWISSDRLFLLKYKYKSSFEKTLKKRAFVSYVSKLQ